MVHVVHLFPETLGLFGDSGNVLALRKRCEWSGIPVTVTTVERGQTIPRNAEIYVIGSGSTTAVKLVLEQIRELKDAIQSAVAQDAVVFAVGAGLHVLGDSIEWPDGTHSPGAGVVPGISRPRTERLVGEFVGRVGDISVAGFFNTGHVFESDLKSHIADIVCEKAGHLETDGIELGGVLGTHSHGSYLPMNPAIADSIISRITGSSVDSENQNVFRADRAAALSREAIRGRLGL